MSDHWKDSRAWQRMAEQRAAWANQPAKLWGVCWKAEGSALVGAATESCGNHHYGTTENKNKWWEGLGWSLWGRRRQVWACRHSWDAAGPTHGHCLVLSWPLSGAGQRLWFLPWPQEVGGEKVQGMWAPHSWGLRGPGQGLRSHRHEGP